MRNTKRPVARRLDRHALYELAVQEPERDAAWLCRWFRRAAGRPLRVLREDFCGTAALAAAFVQRGDAHRAIGIDADAATLAAASRRADVRLTADQRLRLSLVCADVRAVARPLADLTVALNFSYWVFRQRPELLAYLRHVRAGLCRGGFVLLDAFGGGLALRPFAERRQHRGFAHVWEQRAFDPISHRIDCRIHFECKDGSARRDAFVYDWRLWTVPELRDLLEEAGFAAVRVFVEDPRTGEPRQRRATPADPHWLMWIAAQRP